LWGGGSVSAGYRLGRGDIQPWYQERVTNEGGEFSVGFGIPFIKNRTIDDRRAELLKAQQDTLAVEPIIRQQSLEIALLAADAYWTWLANNAKLTVQRELLEIALTRKSQIERSIQLGERPDAANVDNLRLISTRQTSLIVAQRRVESAAIKLSLFLRDAAGQPVLIGQSMRDSQFPPVEIARLNAFDADQRFALENRPELQFLSNQAERLRIELQQAGNIGLPELNWMVDAAQDSGAPSSDKRDKSQFELESGLVGYWEPQQRKMLGKQQAVRGKLTQLQFKRQMVSDKITAELRDARSALNAAARKYDQTRANAELARQTANIFRRSFEEGDIDLIILNIYEEAEAAAKSDVIDARAEYRVAEALYQVAQGELPQ
jgi:outer membrane protein TolC